MKYAVTSQEMKIYDRNTSEVFGISSEVLMERASLKVVERIEHWTNERKCDRRYRALVFSGVGNNGGDGAVIARLLKQKGYLVTLVVVGDLTKISDLLLKQLKICEKYGITPDTFSNVTGNLYSMEWDIIVDALFGIGLSRNVMGSFLAAIEYINSCKEEKKSDLLVISVDIPSGVNADNGNVMGDAVKADYTVTFNQVKLGEILYPGCEYSGKLYVEDVGITDESFLGKEPSAFYFDENINDLLPIRAINENENKIIDNNYFDELNIKNKIIENYNNITQGEISKKMKKKKNKKENNKINEKVEDEKKEEEIKFKDIDEILNYINDTTDTKKGKKKYKKNKKNKNKTCNKEEEKEKDKEIEKEKQKEKTIINNNEDNNNNYQDEFDIQFENFKNDLINNTVFVYEINEKIKPCLSENFLNSIS